MTSRLLPLIAVAALLVCPAWTSAQCTNQVPTMTSNTSPSGWVHDNGIFSQSYKAYKAFDGANGVFWLSKTWRTPARIGYQWASGTRRITEYSIRHANGSSLTSRAPKNWTLRGTNNGGSTWTVLDTRTNQTNWFSGQARRFTVQNPGSFSRYELNITDDNDIRTGVVVISIDRITLETCQSPPVSCPIRQGCQYIYHPNIRCCIDILGDPTTFCPNAC